MKREEEIAKNPLSRSEGEVDETPAELLYRAMLPSLPNYMISLLKILLAAAPTSKAKTESVNILADLLPEEMPTSVLHSMKVGWNVLVTSLLPFVFPCLCLHQSLTVEVPMCASQYLGFPSLCVPVCVPLCVPVCVHTAGHWCESTQGSDSEGNLCTSACPTQALQTQPRLSVWIHESASCLR